MASIDKTRIGKPDAGARASLAQVREHVPESLITYRVSVLAQLLGRVVDTSVRATLKLTSRQWRVMVMLNRLGTATSVDVARSANFDQSQVSRVVSELLALQLIRQQEDPSDRRKVVLQLTPAGIERLRDGLPGSIAREARLRTRLTATEYATFCRALALLEDEARGLLQQHRDGGTTESRRI